MFEYTADGNLKKLRAKSTTPGDQVTEWIYGTTLSISDLTSNALVRQKIYPDSTGSSDRVYLKWNRQSEPREIRDQAAGVHTLQYEYENGSANHVRLKKIVYPTSTSFVEPIYGGGGG